MDGSSLATLAQNLSDAHVTTTNLQATVEKHKKKPLQLSQEITNRNDDGLRDYVTNESNKHYAEAPKKLQVDTVCNLARGYHSFVLAGTGYGKSRIGEMYFHLYAPQRKAVVLVLNPLDSLGEDQDYGIFRPSYGKLGDHLMATNNVPLLLLSATCRPVAIEAILASLMLKRVDMPFFRGELVRTEIRILRFYMTDTLKSCEDLSRMFSKESEIKDKNLLPTLIYSGTRKSTLSVISVLNKARGRKKDDYDSESPLVCRFHACTGEEDKLDSVKAFENKEFPIFSSTMALGLGQNWKRVRCVIHMGRGDPSTISQMMGRCGRDGRPGLAILFMERKQKKGKNKVGDFENEKEQHTDDDRMDAYAVTPVCLRVANAVDNLNGYIPLSNKDPNYLKEKSRHEYLKFDRCSCSNCEPEAAKEIHKLAHSFTEQNFEDMLNDPSKFTLGMPDYVQPKKHRNTTKKYKSRFSQDTVKKIAEDLVIHFESFYRNLMGPRPERRASRYFGEAKAKAVAEAFEDIHEPGLISKLIGGEWFNNQSKTMFSFIESYKKGEWFERQVFEKEEGKRQIENAKRDKEQKKKTEEDEKKKANQKKEADKLAKQAEDAIALEAFKRVRAAEAKERREQGEAPSSSTNSITLQPKPKRVRLLTEDRKKRDEKILADKTAKRAENAVVLEGFKKAQAAEAMETEELRKLT
ncbi:ATP-dependent DNA helicase sgs1 [Puccinia graminis f. sp. tritici]|uniref:DNA 3'-5' helicase n=1 Tax=Puccinia graminis f. sp. tritici TaxID=56615 RepID=A0A5B0M4U0_PUCGR|nr:ATP-dependent DNA helicase sgs1 [Puccinia graminis f. sp. tritici]